MPELVMDGDQGTVGRTPSAVASSTDGVALKQLHHASYIKGFTHNYYRYPATTTPELVREIVLSCSDPEDYVLDPFMGGGTTVVEALAHGRLAVGLDINPVSVFVTRAKTTPLQDVDWIEIDSWRKAGSFRGYAPSGRIDKRTYNLPEEIRAPTAAALWRLRFLHNAKQRSAVRCALLRTVQWALESRDEFPSTDALEVKFEQSLTLMRQGMQALLSSCRAHGAAASTLVSRRSLLRISAEGCAAHRRLAVLTGKIRLVVTSPPYPGVHVLYHRWQVRSRRETPAPFWITRMQDGQGPSYYTMGGRSVCGQVTYFTRLQCAFSDLRPLLRDDAVVAQLVAFSRPDEQLPLFQAAMEAAGYISRLPFQRDESEMIRQVPNRKWYVRGKELDASREYLLFFSHAR